MLRPPAPRPDVLLHTVKRENLNITVTEKGTIESADNRDVVCKVRAGSKGFATSINWVIDDGSKVKKDQLLMLLDDSALQDQHRTQKILVDTALSAKVTADKQYEITVKEGERAVAEQENAVLVAQIDLEKYLGLSFDPAQTPLAAAVGMPAALSESGGFRQQLDDLTGQVRLAEGDLEQSRERAAWADRMVKMKYMSPAQSQAERSKMESSLEKLRGLQTQRSLLIAYDRKKALADLKSKVDNAQRMLDQKTLEAEANRVKADIDRKTKSSILNNEAEKLKDIEDQIHECRISAPQDGMVVYFKNESNRFGGTPQNLIEQGAQVKEGQKLLRIPNLDRMQVNTKVHEAMVSRIKGDVRVATNLVDTLQVGLLANPDPFSRLVSQKEDFQQDLRDQFRHKEYYTASRGQRASVRVDAMPAVQLNAHVRSVAGVASQTDSFMSDVKVYQTLVLIEGRVDGLKPDMTAEVSIHVDGIKEVLAVPLQAIVGGADMGVKRKVFVKTPIGHDERDVTLGLYNEKMVEVRDGLAEGDEVVLNPKVLLGDAKTKTRDADDKGGGSKGGDGKGAAPGEDGGKKGGGDPSKKKGGGMKGGGPGGPGGGGGPPG
ncbi:MAG: HlyD family secretion protein [Gemmataceae bacterium]|nr:HlyD family secretion protein [Gemmataceae bacterium]